MPKFEFKAYNREGILKEGVITAKDKSEALRYLHQQELLVTYLVEKKFKFPIFKKVGLKHIYFFSKQLSYLLKAKIPLDQAVKSISESTVHPHLKSVLIDVYNDLVSGISFSKSLANFPDIFDSYYCGLIKVGEFVGSLDETLDIISNRLYQKMRFHQRTLQAMIYPAIVLILFIVILVLIFYFIVPNITRIFIENNIPLPLITRVLTVVSDFLFKIGPFIIVILASLLYYGFQYFKTREGKTVIFKIVEGIPILGDLVKASYTSQFLESIYHLMKGGVQVVESLEITKSSIGHPIYELALDSIIADVKRGSSLSESMTKFPHVFDNIVIEAFKTGEKTGRLTDVLLTVSNLYLETTENIISTLNELLQPILVVILGIAIGILEAILFIPILNLTKYIQTF